MREFGSMAVLGVLVAGICIPQASAQSGMSGQSHGARGVATGCQEGSPTANDPGCVESAQGFAAPMLGAVVPDSPRAVTALVRVDGLLKRPPVMLPAGNSFTLVGTATLIKVRRADQDACLATGKRISARVNAATSTTCLDREGELLAVQECTPGTPDCAVLLAPDIARQQTVAPR